MDYKQKVILVSNLTKNNTERTIFENNTKNQQRFYNEEIILHSPKSSLIFDKTRNIIRLICKITGNVTTWDGDLETWIFCITNQNK
jgi:hypothetical protein